MSMSQQPIELYYFPTPNGHKITIALEEMGLPYEIKVINILKGDQFNPDYLAFSPNNKMPAIIDPNGFDGQPISVFESGAILQYLGRKTGQFYPTDERKRIEVEEWLMWQMGGFGPMLGQNHHFSKFAPEKLPYAINRYVEETRRLYKVLDKRFSDRDYVAGEYSIADMAIISWALSWEMQSIDLDQYPNVKIYIDRMLARPAVQRALAQKDKVVL
jgi:GST-like protein